MKIWVYKFWEILEEINDWWILKDDSSSRELDG
jgi:hypothetical protein